ncbi:MAG: RNA methyltransferase [Lachnospiraceae bacterium]|nr:RNA methyltransferase [Lachnospiraceae bacterium]
MKTYPKIRLVETTSLQMEEFREELAMYDGLNENQLYHYYEPKIGLFIAESPKVIERAMRAGYEPVSALAEKNHLNQEAEEVLEKISDFFSDKEKEEFRVYVCDHELYSSITGLSMTRGMISVMKRRELPTVTEILEAIPGERIRVTIMDDVENPTNVGAIFRSAAALNMDAVILTSTCSDPLYRRASRVSMGTVFQIPWTFFKGYTPSKDFYLSDATDSAGNQGAVNKQDSSGDAGTEGNDRKVYSYIDELHAAGYKVCAMALTDNSVSIDDPELAKVEKLAVILGNEGMGLPESTIAQCDFTVKIPMAHGVDSLNVAAASAVAFYALTLSK